MNKTYQRLQDNLQVLKLSQMNIHLDEVADQVNMNNISFIEALIRLTDYEIEFQEQKSSRAMIRTANFPFKKEIKDYDFEFQPSLNKQEILDYVTLRFMENHENLVFLGPSGVGKTHLATAIGIAAAKMRISTYFIKCSTLIQQLKRAKLENRLEARLKHFYRYKILIIDEIGYLPIEKEDSYLFFQLIEMRYEKKSTIFTTNMNFNNWDKVFFDPMVANAILDRVLHHANVITITGKSYRLKDHMRQEE